MALEAERIFCGGRTALPTIDIVARLQQVGVIRTVGTVKPAGIHMAVGAVDAVALIPGARQAGHIGVNGRANHRMVRRVAGSKVLPQVGVPHLPRHGGYRNRTVTMTAEADLIFLARHCHRGARGIDTGHTLQGPGQVRCSPAFSDLLGRAIGCMRVMAIQTFHMFSKSATLCGIVWLIFVLEKRR